MLLPMEALAAVGPDPTEISFSVPETLSIKATQGKSELTIDPCVIKNTSAFVGNVIMLSSVEITAADGWSIVASSTDFTAADSKNKIAFTAGSHDFADGAYTPKEEIYGMSNATLQLAGKISEKADLTNATQVASMVLTIEKPVEMISFTIVGPESLDVKGIYQVEEGMSWKEFVNSSYNIDGIFYTENERIVYGSRRPTAPIVGGEVYTSDIIKDGETYSYGSYVCEYGNDFNNVVPEVIYSNFSGSVYTYDESVEQGLFPEEAGESYEPPDGMFEKYFFYLVPDRDEIGLQIYNKSDNVVVMQFIDGRWGELSITNCENGIIEIYGVIEGPIAIFVDP